MTGLPARPVCTTGPTCQCQWRSRLRPWPPVVCGPRPSVLRSDALSPGRGQRDDKEHASLPGESAQQHKPGRVENKAFSDYARFWASISGARSQRGASRVYCEAARAAIRFGGPTTQYVLKCTIAPGICSKWGVELALISLSSSLPSHPPCSAGPRARTAGPKARWHLKFQFRYCSLFNFGWDVLCTTSYRVKFRTSCERRAD